MDAFEKLEKVGEGTYAKVYRAREKVMGKIVPLKKTRLHEDEEGVLPTTFHEVSLRRMLSRDPHVVKVLRLMDVKQGQNKKGKTVLLGQMAKNKKKKMVPTIIYASRTHSHIRQVIQEYRKTTYRVPMAVLIRKFSGNFMCPEKWHTQLKQSIAHLPYE